MQKVIKFSPPRERARARGGATERTTGIPNMVTPRQAATATGIEYRHMLEIAKVHGVRIGRIYYIAAPKLERLLNGEER